MASVVVFLCLHLFIFLDCDQETKKKCNKSRYFKRWQRHRETPMKMVPSWMGSSTTSIIFYCCWSSTTRNMSSWLPFLKVLKRSPLISRFSPWTTYYYLTKHAYTRVHHLRRSMREIPGFLLGLAQTEHLSPFSSSFIVSERVQCESKVRLCPCSFRSVCVFFAFHLSRMLNPIKRTKLWFLIVGLWIVSEQRLEASKHQKEEIHGSISFLVFFGVFLEHMISINVLDWYLGHLIFSNFVIVGYWWWYLDL